MDLLELKVDLLDLTQTKFPLLAKSEHFDLSLAGVLHPLAAGSNLSIH